MKERPLFVLAVSCVLGEVLADCSFSHNLAAAILSSIGLQLFFAAAFFWRIRRASQKNPGIPRHRLLQRTALLLLCMLAGFWSGFLSYRGCREEYAQDLSAYEDEKVFLAGTVSSAEERETGRYYYLSDVSVYAYDSAAGVGECIAAFRKALVIDYEAADGTETSHDAPAVVGRQVTLTAAYSAMNSAANPGNYDEKSYLESKGIGLKAVLESWEMAEGSDLSLSGLLYRVRLALHDRFYVLTDEDTAAFYCGMVLGEGYEISTEEKNVFRGGGIGHILAISGLHISLIGMAIYRVLRGRFGAGVSTAVSILIMILYGALTGGSPSALRAVAMFALRLTAGKCGRRLDFLSAAGCSAFLILLFEPNYLFYSGFQLSYCAVFGAALIVPAIEEYLRVTGALKKALMSGIIIQTVILPVQLLYFYQIAPYGIFLNLLVIPSMGAVLGVGIAGCLIGYLLPAVGGLLFGVGGGMLSFYEWLCLKSMALPGGVLITGAPSGARIAVFYLLLLALLIFVRFSRHREEKKKNGEQDRIQTLNLRALIFRLPVAWYRTKARLRMKQAEEKRLGPDMPFAKRARRWIGVASLFAVALLLVTGRSRSGLKTVFLDVGQGNGIVVESPAGTTWLIDGGSSSVTDVGTYRILPYLRWAGIARIDYMVLTHVDSDHYSGLLEILEQVQTGVKVGCLLVPDMEELSENYALVVSTAEENGVPVYRLVTGVTWEEKMLNIRCVWPDADAEFTDTNEGSGVLYVTYGEFSMLLTGDIGEETESLLVENGVVGGSASESAAPEESTPSEENAQAQTEEAGNAITRITVLGVPHHGSKYSSTSEFLTALCPQIAVVSVGRNLYGHPSDLVISRLKDVGALVYATIDCGAVTLTTDGSSISISGYLGLTGRR